MRGRFIWYAGSEEASGDLWCVRESGLRVERSILTERQKSVEASPAGLKPRAG
jgi:hypothetical protein